MKKLIGINRITNLLIVYLIIILSVSCDDNSRKTENVKSEKSSTSTKYNKTYNTDVDISKISPGAFIYSNTSGMISSKGEIQIQFAKKFDKITTSKPVVVKDILSFSPSIKGKLMYDGEYSLIFHPDKEMKRGEKYNCTVDLFNLYDNIPDDLKYSFSFGIIPLDISVSIGNIKPYDSGDKANNYLDGSVIASDEIEGADINKLLTAKQGRDKLTITRLDSDKKEVIKFRIENIQRKDEKSEVEISWDAGFLGSSDKGEITKTVPEKGIFKLTDIKVINTPDQYIKLTFSDVIDKNINLDGIVYLVNNKNFKLEKQSNSILIYTDNFQTGDAIVAVKKELKNNVGKELEEDYLKEIHFGQLKPAVRFIDEGNIIASDSDNWQLHFQAVNLSKVDIIIYKVLPQNVKQFLQVNDLDGYYQLDRVAKLICKDEFVLIPNRESNNNNWNTYSVDLAKLIANDQNGIYQVRIRFKKEYSLYECQGSEDINNYDNDYGYYDYYDDYYYYPPGYRWSDRDEPCSESYYYYDRFIQKNVLASNLGISVKQNGDSSFIVFANNLLTSKPVSGAKVSVYEYSQEIIATKTTNSEGKAIFEKPGKSWLVLAQNGNDFAYLKIFNGNSLSYSRFETGGVIPTNGINAFIYGDRGVWRPGDTLFLTMIIDDVNDKIPDEHPVNLELYNPKSKLIYKMTNSNGKNGFYSFAVATDQEDITGDWRAKFIIGNVKFYKRIKIENIKPNRLKIDLTYNREMLLPKNNKGFLDVSWLHGGIAAHLRTEINATIRPAVTEFANYKDYVFTDNGKAFQSDEFVMLDNTLDDEGKLTFDIKLPRVYNAPGKLKINTVTRVFEKSGDFSIVPGSVIYSPFEKYVGIKVPEPENNDYLEVDKPHTFKVVVLNNDGQKVSCDNLNVEIFKISWSWWYSYYDNRNPGYIQASYDNRVYSKTISAKNGEAEFDFEISYPMWGRYYVRVTDNSGKHSAGSIFYMDWPSWYSRKNRSNPGDAGLLSLSSDKEEYKIGDVAKISFPTPENATVIVSLERNKRVMKTWDQTSKEKETVIEFPITNEMLPNIYASITVIQSAENDNDLPIRLYGVIPVTINDPSTILKPVISVPDVVKPNTDYKITISENKEKAMTYTIAVVDNGLLSLTNFVTPNPYSTFFAKQALEVSTWDMYDLVSKSFKGNVMRTFAVGGGFAEEDDEVTKNDKANRFKPVVSFMGPFTLNPGEKQTHNLHMSNYVGSVRVMAIAGNGKAFGSSDKQITVKQDLMTVVTAPRKLCPGEKTIIPVTVFRMNENIKDIKVILTGNEAFNIINSEITLNSKEQEIRVEFIVNINDFEGIGKLCATVSSSEHIAFDSIELNVANPNIREYKADNFILKQGETIEKIPVYPGELNTRNINLTVSSVPQINLEKRLNYLIRYPYYCIEQTTSAAFPQLYLGGMVSLDKKQNEKIEKHITDAIIRLSKMQAFSGGFTYWPESNHISDWGTSYAGHFLIVAREKGYSVSPSVMNNWVKYQESKSDNWIPSYNKGDGLIYNDITQAYRLFTLALCNEPNTGAMNRMREMKGLHPQAKYLLASAYALIGQKSIGKNLVKNITWENPVRDYYRSSYGSELRDKAIAAMSLYLLDDDDAATMLMEVAKSLRSNNWYSTQTTAFSLITMALFIDQSEHDDAYSFKYTWNEKITDNIIPVKPIYTESLKTLKDGEKLTITNTSHANAFVTITTSGIPEMEVHPKKEENLIISIKYFDMSGNAMNVSTIPQGTDFYAEVEITNPGIFGNLENLALSQIFPSGWEIMNTRMFDIGSEIVSDKADYTDFRDDRVDFFFNLKKGETKKYIVLLNATYKGNYYLPVTGCSDMYNNNIKASSASQWIKVN